MDIWIILVIGASLCNAVWTSLTKNKDKNLSPLQFTLMFRFYTGLFLIPIFFVKFKKSFINIEFITLIILYALVEGLRTAFIVKGAEKDYYSTFAFVNTSPIFTLILAPFALQERISFVLIFGTVTIIVGAFLFYKIGKFSWWGLSVAFISGIGSLIAKKGVEISNGLSFSVLTFFILVLNLFVIDTFINKKEIIGKFGKQSKKIMTPAFFSALGTAMYFSALETGPISKIAPLLRLNLIFGFFMSYFFLKEIQNWKTKFIGGIFILSGGVLVYIA